MLKETTAIQRARHDQSLPLAVSATLCLPIFAVKFRSLHLIKGNVRYWHLSRPGGNITGVYLFTSTIESKRLGLLRALVPGVQLIAVLLNPNRQDYTRPGR